jgi:predicted phosphoribosyltransferase
VKLPARRIDDVPLPGKKMTSQKTKAPVVDLQKLRNRVHVFRDRQEAGQVLASMLERYRETDALVLGVPAGGVAVAVIIARELNLALDVAIVSKITLSWNTESGYGAVAFDGTVLLNHDYLSRLRLSHQEMEEGVARTREKVSRRMEKFRGNRPFPDLRRPVILVDDGIASGFTLLTAVEALRKAGCKEIILAVPTAHEESLARILEKADAIYCPNLRGGWSFAVADAYEHWRDLEEQEVLTLLEEFNKGSGGRPRSVK